MTDKDRQATPADAGELAAGITDAVTQWFRRDASTTEAQINDLGSESRNEPTVELTPSCLAQERVVVARVRITIEHPAISLDYDLGAQFQHGYSGHLPDAVLAEFMRATAAPMLIGMIRGAIATESAIFGVTKILLPYFIEAQIRTLPDEAFINAASDDDESGRTD